MQENIPKIKIHTSAVSQQDGSSVTEASLSDNGKEKRQPGESVFMLLLTAFGVLGYYFALDMTHDNYSSPAVFPKIASLLIICSGLFLFFQSLNREKKPSCLSVLSYLMPGTVTVMMSLMVLYCIAIPYAHFPASSFIFLISSLACLYKGKNIMALCLYSAVSLTILIIIFRYIMLVILP